MELTKLSEEQVQQILDGTFIGRKKGDLSNLDLSDLKTGFLIEKIRDNKDVNLTGSKIPELLISYIINPHKNHNLINPIISNKYLYEDIQVKNFNGRNKGDLSMLNLNVLSKDYLIDLYFSDNKYILNMEGVIMNNNKNLALTHLSGSNLKGADLSNNNMTRSNLSKADLTGVNLSGTNLENSNLSKAILTNANLSNACLRNVNLTGAKLENVNLKGANLTGVKITKEQFKEILKTNEYMYSYNVDFIKNFNISNSNKVKFLRIFVKERIKLLKGKMVKLSINEDTREVFDTKINLLSKNIKKNIVNINKTTDKNDLTGLLSELTNIENEVNEFMHESVTGLSL